MELFPINLFLTTVSIQTQTVTLKVLNQIRMAKFNPPPQKEVPAQFVDISIVEELYQSSFNKSTERKIQDKNKSADNRTQGYHLEILPQIRLAPQPSDLSALKQVQGSSETNLNRINFSVAPEDNENSYLTLR